MRRALALAPLLLLAAGCGKKVPDFSGVWHMTETDREYKSDYSRSFLFVQQHGDRVTLKAWGDGKVWSCDGRGQIEDGRLKFRWEGREKGWSGVSELVRNGQTLRGTYRRNESGAAEQYCRGEYARAAP